MARPGASFSRDQADWRGTAEQYVTGPHWPAHRVLENVRPWPAAALDAPLRGQESIDLMASMAAETAPSRTAHGRIDLAMVLVAGLGAGVVATLAQIALWLAGNDSGTSAGRHSQLSAWLSLAGASSTMHVNAMQHRFTLSIEA
jgi:hypothetical protein